MNTLSPHSDELSALLIALTDGDMDRRQFDRLQGLLSQDPDSQTYFRQYMRLCALLEFERAAAKDVQAEFGDSERAVGDANPGATVESPFLPDSSIPFSPISPLPSPLSPPSFIGGPVFSYMVATLILGVMLLSAWAYTITLDPHVKYVDNSRGQTAPGDSVPKTPEPVFVGRVTGMKDCRWADPRTATYLGASVSLNRKYALSSGLLEIAYASGAKVILEGPCDYVVESDIGGFLSLGKLTARVDVAKPQAAKPQDPSPKTQDRNPKSPSSLFSVRTPTAVVTDLGTEFGVEVGEDGNTTSYVFRGSVRVEVGAGTGLASGTQLEAMVLRANESVRVEKVGRVRETHHAPEENTELVRFTHPTTLPKFVRRIHEPPKLLDLLDIVAGGNGLGNRRERGIDQSTGYQDTVFQNSLREQDSHEYHLVGWSRFIDGVFVPYVPSYRIRKVQLDSSGNEFGGFTEHRMNNGMPITCTVLGKSTGSIWARAADASSGDNDWLLSGWIYALTNDKTFMPEGRGLLGMHSNSGVTFDLAELRAVVKESCLTHFQAVAGMGIGPRNHSDHVGMADLWVFVDGRLKWSRLDVCAQDGAIKIDVPLGRHDRFLTLACTNGRNGQGYDWVVFGDPALTISSEADNGKQSEPCVESGSEQP